MIIMYIVVGTLISTGIGYYLYNECNSYGYQVIREVELNRYRNDEENELINKKANNISFSDTNGITYNIKSLNKDEWELIDTK